MSNKDGLTMEDGVLLLFFFVLTWVGMGLFEHRVLSKLDAICAQVECEVEP